MPDGYAAVDGALEFIHNNLDQRLSLSTIACYASYSPFHFARLFKARVGIPTQHYVSTLRLHRAKQLLLSTDLNVREIALEIGQQSLGTFTTQFSARVGLSLARFRQSKAQAVGQLRSLLSFDLCQAVRSASDPRWGQPVTGAVQADVAFDGIILFGLFRSPVAEGIPLYSTMLNGPGDFCFPSVKAGRYYFVGTTIISGAQARDILLPHATLRTTSKEPIEVTAYSRPPHLHVTLTPPQVGDAPVLISLPFVMARFLQMTTGGNAMAGVPGSK